MPSFLVYIDSDPQPFVGRMSYATVCISKLLAESVIDYRTSLVRCQVFSLVMQVDMLHLTPTINITYRYIPACLRNYPALDLIGLVSEY